MVSKADATVGGGHVVEEFVAVFADERFLVVAGDVVPRDSVIVDIVQHAEARLVGSVDVELCVVRLACLLVTRGRPGVVPPTTRDLVGGRHTDAGRRPEPTVDVLRLQVPSTLATLEVTDSPTRPNVGDVV